MKIVINRCFGGFSLSEEAYKFLGLEWDGYGYKCTSYDDRTDPDLIKCVETLGDKANGSCANLKVIEIPDGVDWEITDYDGLEKVEEVHRIWY